MAKNGEFENRVFVSIHWIIWVRTPDNTLEHAMSVFQRAHYNPTATTAPLLGLRSHTLTLISELPVTHQYLPLSSVQQFLAIAPASEANSIHDPLFRGHFHKTLPVVLSFLLTLITLLCPLQLSKSELDKVGLFICFRGHKGQT